MTVSMPRPDAAGAAPGSVPSRVHRAEPLGMHAAIVVTSDGQGPASAAVTGELDLACADALTAALCSALDEHAAGVLLDLAAVDFFDCAALHALERARDHAAHRGRRFALERSSAAVDLVLDLARPLWCATTRPAPGMTPPDDDVATAADVC